MKKIPQRTCMGCNKKKDKRDLLRIVINKEGTLNVDKTGKLSGRGAYICKEIECFEAIKKNKKLERALETKISENFYEEIREVIVSDSK